MSSKHNTIPLYKKVKKQLQIWIPSIIFFIMGIGFFVIAQNFTATAAKKKYDMALAQTRSETYDKFYNTAFKHAEERNHTKNQVTISVSNIKEIAVLEVLEVNASEIKEYKMDNELTKPLKFLVSLKKNIPQDVENEVFNTPGAVVWLQGSCTGIFTTDLNASEIIVDNDRHYVLVRVPVPSITRYETPSFDVKYFNNNTPFPKLLNGSAKIGLDAAIEDTADLTECLHEIIYEKAEYRQMARESAELLIKNLVKGLNPEISDLQVDIEFFS